jgi:hypothetical protein
LALFGRRPHQRVDSSIIPATENLHNRRHSSLAGKHETDPEMRKFVAAFEQGMRAAGWIRGVNVR